MSVRESATAQCVWQLFGKRKFLKADKANESVGQ